MPDQRPRAADPSPSIRVARLGRSESVDPSPTPGRRSDSPESSRSPANPPPPPPPPCPPELPGSRSEGGAAPAPVPAAARGPEPAERPQRAERREEPGGGGGGGEVMFSGDLRKSPERERERSEEPGGGGTQGGPWDLARGERPAPRWPTVHSEWSALVGRPLSGSARRPAGRQSAQRCCGPAAGPTRRRGAHKRPPR